jgi:hypothetical protein
MICSNPEKFSPSPLSNEQLARCLSEIADRLDAQRANPYRVRAYRSAAVTVHELNRPVHEMLADEGVGGLAKLPGIGKSLSRALEKLTRTGRLALLEQLRGTTTGDQSLATVPGIGRKTASRIHSLLGIETLADLYTAAYDGRLEHLPGIGRKRLRAVRESLAGRLHPPPRPAKANKTVKAVEERLDLSLVADLLGIDEEYRRKAEADRLLRIAPRQFNPTGEAWLSILETHRGDTRFKAFFSNSARAHEFGTLRDWVVICCDQKLRKGQWTIVTARRGALKGRRIIRGHESECAEFYKCIVTSP